MGQDVRCFSIVLCLPWYWSIYFIFIHILNSKNKIPICVSAHISDSEAFSSCWFFCFYVTLLNVLWALCVWKLNPWTAKDHLLLIETLPWTSCCVIFLTHNSKEARPGLRTHAYLQTFKQKLASNLPFARLPALLAASSLAVVWHSSSQRQVPQS